MPTLEQAQKWYAGGDAVHDFDHVMRVYRLAEHIGEKEGADLGIVRAAALLHDAEGTNPGNAEERAGHHKIAAQFAEEVLRGEGWPEERIQAVAHCIQAHRFRSGEEPETIEAQVLFDADKLDAIGAIGAARAFAFAVLAGQPLHAEPSEKFLKTFETESAEAYTAYHEFLFKLSKIKDRLYTQTGKALSEARHEYLAGFFKQLRAEVKGER